MTCRKIECDDKSEIPLPARNQEFLRDCSENKENSVDEDFVDQLVLKGYDKLRAIDALRVARNDPLMAEEILETFVSK